ncbi:signal peptidase II [Rhodobacteraceae bacterium RKSG542]|uniref:signal peptidase II n=1 Tax=Pseudovibrio flavus TaxID=2529854 RepID=UPI0012BB8B5C|nr:signal peptidase II [Pseudovibrio flavus]MTI18608.1 signal peptidase II [Pseudovibrio flavus]
MKERWLWGRFSPLVATLGIVGMAIDQIVKIWVVHIYDMANNPPISLTPFLDIILIWNKGVSYGLFQQDSTFGRWALALFTIGAAVLIWVWGVRTKDRLLAISLGLVLAGAIGNGIDRLYYGKVVDFVYFNYGDFSWYVFNLADVWIVLGAAGLIFDSFFGGKQHQK